MREYFDTLWNDPIKLAWALIAINLGATYSDVANTLSVHVANVDIAPGTALGSFGGTMIGTAFHTFGLYRLGEGRWRWFGWFVGFVCSAIGLVLVIYMAVGDYTINAGLDRFESFYLAGTCLAYTVAVFRVMTLTKAPTPTIELERIEA